MRAPVHLAATRAQPAVMSADAALDLPASIDLTMIRSKLAKPEVGEGWSDAELDLGAQEYRRFLALHLMYPEMDVVPCGLVVDSVWHAHILDTQAYAPDCERVFGFFLHHFPYFGMRGEQDASDLESAYDQTSSNIAPLSASHRPAPGSLTTRRAESAGSAAPNASRRSVGSANSATSPRDAGAARAGTGRASSWPRCTRQLGGVRRFRAARLGGSNDPIKPLTCSLVATLGRTR